MSYLLDTCVLSEYVRKKPNEKVIQWLDYQEETHLFISLLSIREIKKGIVKIEQKQPQHYQKLSRWLQKIEVRFAGRIIGLDRNIINTWAILCGQCEAKGQKLPIMDSLIAATAYQKGLTIVTRNVTDFQFASLKVFSPWDG